LRNLRKIRKNRSETDRGKNWRKFFPKILLGKDPKEKLISLMEETYEEALKIAETTPRPNQE
jgi:hypothetical protein